MNTFDNFVCAQIIADLIVESPKFDNDLLNKLNDLIVAYDEHVICGVTEDTRAAMHVEALCKVRCVVEMHLRNICPKMTEQLAYNVAELVCDNLGISQYT